jgi:hypothetical protein
MKCDYTFLTATLFLEFSRWMTLHSTRPNRTPTASSVCRSTSPFCLIHPEDVSVMYAETFKQLQYTTRLNPTLKLYVRSSCLELSSVDTWT